MEAIIKIEMIHGERFPIVFFPEYRNSTMIDAFCFYDDCTNPVDYGFYRKCKNPTEHENFRVKRYMNFHGFTDLVYVRRMKSL